MTNHLNTRRALFLYMPLILIVCIISFVIIKGQQQIRPPKVVSKAKSLEVLTTAIIGDTEQTATIVIEVRNNSDKAVTAIAIESGDAKDASGINISGFRSADEPPSTIIAPHGTKKIEFPLSNLLPDKPFKVGGVIFADETEEGDTITLGTMHRQRDHDRAEGCKRKGGCSHP